MLLLQWCIFTLVKYRVMASFTLWLWCYNVLLQTADSNRFPVFFLSNCHYSLDAFSVSVVYFVLLYFYYNSSLWAGHPHFKARINKLPSCLLNLITSVCVSVHNLEHVCCVSSEGQGSASEGAAEPSADGDWQQIQHGHHQATQGCQADELAALLQ